MTRSFKSKLAITLDKLLKPFIPQQYIVKDTFEFINRLKAFDTHSNIQYVSFDANSLLTNIPIEKQSNIFAISFHLNNYPLITKLLNNSSN